jgi:protein transport protein SEC61 subunit gamma-like protein
VITKEKKYVPEPFRTWQGSKKMKIETKAEEIQNTFETRTRNLGRGKYGRILKMAHTPTREEYKKTCYIAALGMIVIGAVGFAIMWVMTYLPGYF